MYIRHSASPKRRASRVLVNACHLSWCQALPSFQSSRKIQQNVRFINKKRGE